jgi:hypothetical protein
VNKTIFLVPDTNFFVQCKEPREMDWIEYSKFDHVELLITRPVQAELDNQKGKGSGRLANRARKASSLIRELLLSDDDFLIVREHTPKVTIRIRQDLLPDEALKSVLDYGERDDQLVGVTSSLKQEVRDSDVALLTHDTGPMASAKMVGLPFKVIPDSWLIPPEQDESEKRTNALLAELNKYKNSEPKFKLTYQSEGSNVTSVECQLDYYEPLTNEEVNNLIWTLEQAFPQEFDFGSREPIDRPVSNNNPFLNSIFDEREKFTPATDESITSYTEQLYPGWLENCKSIFDNIHTSLNQSIKLPEITIGVENIGSRPAIDALTTFTAKGPFLIAPSEAYADQIQENAIDLSIPDAPKAPKGTWKKTNKFHGLHGLQDLAGLASLGRSNFDYGNIPVLSGLKSQRDQNAFYWKPERPSSPVKTVVLECQQWRHQIGEELFKFVLCAELKLGQARGVLELRIDSANMTETFDQRVNIKITVNPISPLAYSQNLVQELLNR